MTDNELKLQKLGLTPYNRLSFAQKEAAKSKGKGNDDDMDKDEDGDKTLCGIKCLTIPKVIYAPYIKNLLNDYIRAQ